MQRQGRAQEVTPLAAMAVCVLALSDPDSGRLICGGDTIRYRLPDVDAPEIRGARCEAEAVIGRAYRDTARAMLDGTPAQLVTTAEQDRWGRYVTDVVLADGRSLRDTMLDAGLVVVWHYGREPKPVWCND